MRRQDVQDATGKSEYNPGYGQMRAWGTGAPAASTKGYAPGCLYQNLTGTSGICFYVNVGTFLSSRWVNLDRYADTTGRIITPTAGFTVTSSLYDRRTVVMSLLAGFTVTLSPATGSGTLLRFMIGIVNTSGSYIINAVGADVFNGSLPLSTPASTWATANIGETFASTAGVTITLNGTATGGATIGDYVELEDIALHTWAVRGWLTTTTTPTTPFS